MAVLAADVQIPHFAEPIKITGPADAADIFYAGAIVWGKEAGRVTCAPASGDRPIGIVTRQQTTLAAGDPVEYYCFGLFQFPALSGVTVADIGELAVFDVSVNVTDNPADVLSGEDVTLAANDAIIGRIVSFLDNDSSKPLVLIGGMTGMLYDATGATSWV